MTLLFVIHNYSIPLRWIIELISEVVVARIRKTFCLMDFIYFLRRICKKKNLFYNLAETVPISRPRLWRKSARKIKFNLIINLIIEQL